MENKETYYKADLESDDNSRLKQDAVYVLTVSISINAFMDNEDRWIDVYVDYGYYSAMSKMFEFIMDSSYTIDEIEVTDTSPEDKDGSKRFIVNADNENYLVNLEPISMVSENSISDIIRGKTVRFENEEFRILKKKAIFGLNN